VKIIIVQVKFSILTISNWISM